MLPAYFLGSDIYAELVVCMASRISLRLKDKGNSEVLRYADACSGQANAIADITMRSLRRPFAPAHLEGRAVLEYAALIKSDIFTRPQQVDKSITDKYCVVIIPGLYAGDGAVSVLRKWVGRLGFETRETGIRSNIDYTLPTLEGIRSIVNDVSSNGKKRVVLIGHSRGGMLARILGEELGDNISGIICMGSPQHERFALPAHTLGAAALAYGLSYMRRGNMMEDEIHLFSALEKMPKQNTVSIYSRTDGVVDWRSCIGDGMECVEVNGSHLGMIVNKDVYKIIYRYLSSM